MNANELADELDVASSEMEYNHVVDDWKLLSDAATMLRQQQAENEELKKECAWAKDQWNKDRICFESRLKTLNRDYNFMKDLAIGTEELLRKAQEK